jgi:hypothetical protein
MRSKLRAPVLQNLFNFVHKPTPAGSKTALQPLCCKPYAMRPDNAASARKGDRLGKLLVALAIALYVLIARQGGWL